MTPSEVVWFCNHKYGECGYVVEDKDYIHIYTIASKWLIKKNDFSRFGFYTLYHSNNNYGQGYHVQLKAHDLDYLVYRAVTHDFLTYKQNSWIDFKKSWEWFKYGQLLYESVRTFEFLSE